MAEHDPQYLIELDGNQSPEELFTVSSRFSKSISVGKFTALYLIKRNMVTFL
jgi:hypothetical protein